MKFIMPGNLIVRGSPTISFYAVEGDWIYFSDNPSDRIPTVCKWNVYHGYASWCTVQERVGVCFKEDDNWQMTQYMVERRAEPLDQLYFPLIVAAFQCRAKAKEIAAYYNLYAHQGTIRVVKHFIAGYSFQINGKYLPLEEFIDSHARG